MKRKTKDKIVSRIFVVLCVCVAIAGTYFYIIEKPLPEVEANSGTTTVCTRVVDGDTIVISGVKK